MFQIFTASWFSELPDGFFRVSISRSAPSGTPAGWRAYKPLAPGRWFSSAPAEDYLHLYSDEILRPLDPVRVVADLAALTGGAPAVLLCWERPESIAAGAEFCHRHLAATWLEQRLSLTVPEVGFAGLDRFRALRALELTEPDYRANGDRLKIGDRLDDQPRPPPSGK